MTAKGPRGSSSHLLQLRDELEERVRVRTADLEKAVAENEELVTQLRQANEAKDEFLGMLSHELRTSMTLIYGGIKAIRRMGGRLDAEETVALLENVEQETDSLYRMIEDLLNLARLELGEQLTTEPVLVQHVIQKFARSFSHNRPNREVLVDVPDDLEPVLAEPTYVEQILRNLMSNAEKYSPPDSPVELRVAHLDQRELVISVLDRGPGIPEEEAEAVFERFYRSQPPRARARHGNGTDRLQAAGRGATGANLAGAARRRGPRGQLYAPCGAGAVCGRLGRRLKTRTFG